MSDLGVALTPIITDIVKGEMEGLDIEGQIKNLLKDVAQNTTKVLEIKLDGKEDGGKKFPLVHKQFEDLVAVVAMGENTLITGGAGLSKSTAVEQCAEALGLDLVPMSFSNQTTKTDLFGFVDANGIYRYSGFVDAFENGKLFLGDEMDACGANVFVLLNSAIENGFLLTPDNKKISVHEKFRFVGTANTNLRGAKDGFTARNKLDAASIDRFVVIEWELDLILEEKITNNAGWLNIVRKCRLATDEQLDGIVITPRPSYKGAKLLKAGIAIGKVIEWTLVKALGQDERDVLMAAFTAEDVKNAATDAGQIKEVQEIKEDDTEIYETKYEEIDDNGEEKDNDDFGEW